MLLFPNFSSLSPIYASYQCLYCVLVGVLKNRLTVWALPAGGVRQHHWGTVPDSRKDFHKKINYWNIQQREREGQSHQLHCYAFGHHRGRVRKHTLLSTGSFIHPCSHCFLKNPDPQPDHSRVVGDLD